MSALLGAWALIFCLTTAVTHTAAAGEELCKGKATPKDKANLIQSVLAQADKDVRPQACGGPALIRLRYELSSFYQEAQQPSTLFSINGDLDMSWNDSRLSWDPKKFQNIETIKVPITQIWSPDVILYSGAKMAQNFFGESDMLRATISSSGAVLYSPQTSASFLCNVTSDKSGELVSCVQRIGSWVYDKTKVDVETEDDKINVDPFDIFHTSKFVVESATANRSEVKYPCCPDTFAVLDIHLQMRKSKASPK